MGSKNTTNSKKVIEIADYAFANPLANRGKVLAKFGKQWQIPTRTLDRLWKQAKEYNLKRTDKQEKAKNEELTVEARESIKKGILTRDESLKLLSGIAKKSRYASDRVRAITQLAKMEGWDAPAKNELTGADGKPLYPEPLVIEIIDSRENVKRNENTDD
jgi:hypothetical protein